MRIPPLLARVQIGGRADPVAIWFPIVLLWLPLLLLLAPLLLLALMAALVAPRRWSLLGILRGLWAAFCETRGASIDFQGARRRVSIALH